MANLVIIPAFNESLKIGDIIEKVKKSLAEADILIVDDGSSDRTAEVASKHGVKAVSLPFNLGYGAALETGYKYGFKEGYEYVVQMDADGQHEPRCINDLLAGLKNGEADIVIGSRYLKDCGYKTTFARYIGTFIFSKIATLFSGQKITDPTSGFQALNRKVLEFFIKGFYPSDYPDADVLILLNKSGFRISEIPVIMYSSDSKKSMHAGFFKPLYYNFKMFLSILMIFLRKKPF